MQPSKLALTRGRACPGDRVSERRVDPEDLRVSSALSGTRERTMKKNCTCAEEMLGTGSRDPLGLHHIPDSVPTAPAPLPGSNRAPAQLESCAEPPAATSEAKPLEESCPHHARTRQGGEAFIESKAMRDYRRSILPSSFLFQTYRIPSHKTEHRK